MESLLPSNRLAPTCCSYPPPMSQRPTPGQRSGPIVRAFRPQRLCLQLGNSTVVPPFQNACFIGVERRPLSEAARTGRTTKGHIEHQCLKDDRGSSSCRAPTHSCRSTTANSPTVLSPDVEQRQQQSSSWVRPEVSGTSQSQRRGQQVEKVGVLLLNLGGPETLDDVQPFLYNLFSDDSIIRLPPQGKFLQPLVANIISTLRAPKSSEGYKSIGGGSPLRRITQEQADALSLALKDRGLDACVYVGMRYWKPFTEEAIEQIKQDRITRLVVLPLYPHFSISTSASSLRLFESMLQNDQELQGLKHIVIASWYWRNGYLTAMSDLIENELHKFEDQGSVEIFFSAHGVPKSYVEEYGDPYKEEIEQCVGMVMNKLRERQISNHHTLAYQSRGFTQNDHEGCAQVEWLKPYTDDAIKSLGKQGTKSLLAVPISFVSEHIETLEEIDMEYRELALRSGVQNWGRVPALNTNRTFINDLAELVIEKLPSAQPRPGYVSEALNLGPPTGSVEELLDTYDRDRRVLPPPVKVWEFGWTKSAEMLNGRIAMIAVLVMLILEAATGQGVLSSWFKL